jgi:hypothetical protein
MIKKIIFVIFISSIFWSCQDANEPTDIITRSADPCDTWAKPGWQSGSDSIKTQALRDGNASHLTPAEIIYFSILENSDNPNIDSSKYFINPILILVYLEKKNLLTRGKDLDDFELRLLQAFDYGGEKIKKYHGFYPQTVAATYQWRRFQERNLTFEEAQIAYSFRTDKSFREFYASYAKIMNEIIGSNYSLYPDSKGYYQDFFKEVGIEDIQKFFEKINSPLKEDLFKQAPVKNSVIDYKNMIDYCE